MCNLQSAACLGSSSSDTGKGQSKLSGNKLTHGFHLVEGRSGHDMEDYHVAEYRYENDHELGLFAIYDGHLGDSVASYLKANLFNNILKEVGFTFVSYFLYKTCVVFHRSMKLFSWNLNLWHFCYKNAHPVPFYGDCSLSFGQTLKKQLKMHTVLQINIFWKIRNN